MRIPPKIWMLIAVMSFCIMAIAIKEIDQEMSPFEIIFFRSTIGLVVIWSFFKKDLIKPTFSVVRDNLLRNIFHLIGQFGWIIGIVYLGLAEATAIEFSVPIWVLIIATIFLKEKLTLGKGISISLGFFGVLLILNPEYGTINQNHFIVLSSAVGYAITHTLTKRLTSKYSSLNIVFMMCLIQTPISFIISLSTFTPPSLRDLLFLLIIGLAAITAHFTMAKAMEGDDVSSIISIDYIRLPILLIIGIVMYNEEFSSSYLFGGCLILLGNAINNSKLLKQKIKTMHNKA